VKLFSSIGRTHLDGHKDLTNNGTIINLSKDYPDAVKNVYFPTMAPNGKLITILVNPGDEVKVGTKIGERTDFNVPVYSSVSGKVLEQEVIYSAQVGRAINHVVIENDNKYECAEPFKTITKDSSNEDIFNAIINAGMVGMGGAGFPTYIKYNQPKDIDTILVNGVECEPYITSDYVTTQTNVDILLKTIDLLVKYSGANQGIIAIKEHKIAQKQAIEAKISEYPNIKLVEVGDFYPMGWERTLIKEVLNRTYANLPAQAHVILNNIQTVIGLGKALFEGKPVTERIVTVSGNGLNMSFNILCPIGTLNSELVNVCGGYVDGDIDLLPGGPMCGKAINNDKFPVVMQQGALTVLKHVTYHQDACLRCGRCTEHCPANLQPVELKNAFDRKDFDRLEKLSLMSCVGCGMCSYVCPSHIELTDNINKAKLVYKLKKK